MGLRNGIILYFAFFKVLQDVTDFDLHFQLNTGQHAWMKSRNGKLELVTLSMGRAHQVLRHQPAWPP